MKLKTVLLTFFLLTGYIGFGAGMETFTGRIILIDGDTVEIKKGKREIEFTVTDKTRVVKNGAEPGIGSLEICQHVTARYTVQGKNVFLESITIIKESDCQR